MGAMVTFRKKPQDVIVLDEDHGGYKTAHCFACGAHGWLDGLGHPYWAKNAPGAHLKHKRSCPMNPLLDSKGNLRKEKKVIAKQKTRRKKVSKKRAHAEIHFATAAAMSGLGLRLRQF